MAQALDCVIVGGGPAGLTAGIYLARFCRSVRIIDKDEGRLAMIPRTHNHPGFPGGIPGCDLLERMRVQAREQGATLLRGTVTDIRHEAGLFHGTADCGDFVARTVLLATGVVNLRPPIPESLHADAVARGLLRYCPICDGYEQRGKRIAVLGADGHGLAEALFLRQFSDQIILQTLTTPEAGPDLRQRMREAGVTLVETPMSGIDFAPPGEDAQGGVTIRLADGAAVTADTLYCALGSQTRNDLGRSLGVDLQDGQCFVTDRHQRCSVPGVYAAGDAIEGLDQISAAMGTGAQAAVSIHNDLRREDGETLDG